MDLAAGRGPGEIEELASGARRPLDRAQALAHELVSLVRVGLAREQLDGPLEHEQRVVEVVGDAAREASRALESLAPHRGLERLGPLGLGRTLLGPRLGLALGHGRELDLDPMQRERDPAQAQDREHVGADPAEEIGRGHVDLDPAEAVADRGQGQRREQAAEHDQSPAGTLEEDRGDRRATRDQPNPEREAPVKQDHHRNPGQTCGQGQGPSPVAAGEADSGRHRDHEGQADDQDRVGAVTRELDEQEEPARGQRDGEQVGPQPEQSLMLNPLVDVAFDILVLGTSVVPCSAPVSRW